MHNLELPPPQTRYSALVASLIFHTVLFTSLGLLWQPEVKGLDQPDRPIGIAFVNVVPAREPVDQANESPASDREAAEPSNTDTLADTRQVKGATGGGGPLSGSGEAPPLDLQGLLASTVATPEPMPGGPSADAAGSETAGTPGGSSRVISTLGDSGSKIHAQLFGVDGYGHRFVYVLDRSDSMNGFNAKPLNAAKQELIRSLQAMTEKQEFQVIFYNDEPIPMKIGPTVTVLNGEKRNLSMVRQAINLVMASGGTNHDAALKLAMRMRPDVIFFLTDARLPPLSNYQINEIRARANADETTIHCIEFGVEPTGAPGSFLERLATSTGGQYKYVNVLGL